MQVTNIEITVSNEIAQEVLVGLMEDTCSVLRFTELQAIGGGDVVTVW